MPAERYRGPFAPAAAVQTNPLNQPHLVHMYKDYFGFLENPFSIAPDPRYLYMSEMHQDGLAHLEHGLSADGCITLLTGEVGTGKTTLCRFFLDRIDPTAKVALIINPGLSAFELLATLCDEFQIRGTDHFYSTKHYLDALNEFLLQAHAKNNPALLVIDEAQNLDKEALEMVRLLTNLETDQQKLLRIILLGQSEMSTLLTSPDLSQVNQRITGRFHLSGLDSSETGNYIRHRLSVAGGGQTQPFRDGAVRKIHQLTGGIPRLINSLCDRSLIGAYAEEQKLITTSIVKRAAKEILGFDRASKTIEIPLSSLVAGALALVVVVLVWVGTTSDIFHLKLSTLLPPPQSAAVQDTDHSGVDDSSPGQDAPTITDGGETTPEPVPPPETTDENAAGAAAELSPADEPGEAQIEVFAEETGGQSNIVISPVEISAGGQPRPETKIFIKGIEISE